MYCYNIHIYSYNIQCRFNQDATVLQPDLFDIYISYYPKPLSIATPTSSSSSYTATSTSMATPLSPLLQYDELDFPQTVPSSALAAINADNSNSKTKTAKTSSSTSSTLDPELLLLIRGAHLPNWAVSGKEKECSSFHHGSHLLYTRRGLLETLPLSYTCSSTSPGSSCKDSPGANSDTKVTDTPRSESLLASYLSVHKPSKNLGYMFSYKNNTAATSSSGDLLPPTPASQATPTSKTTPTTLPPTVTNIPVAPKELYLFIESLKPGSLYTAVINFESPIYLTDMTLQMSTYMCSVAVDVWTEEGLEDRQKQRIAQSCELKTHSLILGNIMPPVLCQFARISYVAHMSASSEKCAASLGCFYGLPFFSPEKPLSVIKDGLQYEISKTLTRYYKAREELLDTISMYKHCPSSSLMLKQQMEKQISVLHTDCFNIQVRLARLKSVYESVGQSKSKRYSLEALKREVDVTTPQLPLKKLLKLTSCLIDSILIIIEQNVLSTSSASISEPVMGQDVFRSLFIAHCVHGARTMHAKTCAVLIHLCGGQPWWGQVLADLFKELFSCNQTRLISKERLA